MTFVSTVTGLAPYAWYRLNESSGTTLTDSSSNSRNGTYSGTFTLQQTGYTNDGNHSVLSTANTFFNLTSGSTQPGNSPTTPFTIAFIYKPGTLSTSYVASAQNGDNTHFWQLIHDNTAHALQLNLNATVIGSATDTFVPLASNGGAMMLWLTYDGAGAWNIYVNGSSSAIISTTGKPITQNSTTYSLIVDSSLGASNLSSVGNFQDIMLFNSVVSNANRSAVFAATGITPALVAGITTSTGLPSGANISWTTAGTGGVAPITYQLYRSSVPSSSISGQTLVYTGTNNSYIDDPGDYGVYFYIVKATDSASTPQTVQNILYPGQKQKSYAVFAIGDSRTMGVNATYSAGGDPVTQLAYQLDARLGNCNWNIVNRGASGALTSHWLPHNTTYPASGPSASMNYTFTQGQSLFDTAMTAFTNALATYPTGTQVYFQIMLGANESIIPFRVPVSTYVANMQTIINAIKSANIPGFAGILLHCTYYSVPIWNPASYAYDEMSDNLIQQYNAALSQLVDNQYVFLGDTKAFSFFASFAQGPLGLLNIDGIHPADCGYSAQATLWAKSYMDILNPSVTASRTNPSGTVYQLSQTVNVQTQSGVLNIPAGQSIVLSYNESTD